MSSKILIGPHDDYISNLKNEYINAMKSFMNSLETEDSKLIKEKYVQLLRLNISLSKTTSIPSKNDLEEAQKLEMLFEKCAQLFVKNDENFDTDNICKLAKIINHRDVYYKMQQFIDENFDLIINSDSTIEEMPKNYMGRLARARKAQEVISKHRK